MSWIYCLRVGLKNGQWYFFMDSENQNLYHSTITFKGCKGSPQRIFPVLCELQADGKLPELSFLSSRRSIRFSELILVIGTGLDKGADVTTSVYKKGKDQLEILTRDTFQIGKRKTLIERILYFFPRSVLETQ